MIEDDNVGDNYDDKVYNDDSFFDDDDDDTNCDHFGESQLEDYWTLYHQSPFQKISFPSQLIFSPILGSKQEMDKSKY